MRRLNPNDDTNYRFVRREDDGDGPWETCDCCDFPAPLDDYGDGLCQLCSNTVGDDRAHANHAANAILLALGAFGELPPRED
jgi:hypothetical protein